MKMVNCKFFLKTLLVAITLCSLSIVINDSYAAPRAAIRGSAGARKPVAKKTTQAETPEPAAVEAEPVVVKTKSEPKTEPEKVAAVNKSNQFDSVISSSTSTSSSDKDEIAERIRQQRAAIEAQDAQASVATKATSGRNACDFGLRECMTKTCGKDFTKCATDGDTDLGIKFNACRRDLTCTGEEFKLFTTEIKADRDMNVQLSSYNAVIDCAKEYIYDCLFVECGEKLEKCIGKSAADKAMNKCKSIANKCKEQDSGLASRFGSIIGILREHAEVNVKTKEERMYKLRDLMRSACEKLGAAFDERTFDCIYTVSFFAGKEQTVPMSSRKRYAGDTFVCNQEWFGIDVTTFKENAYRETRAQTAASSAMLGSGIGMTAGLLSSGAIGRALDRQKAQKELDQAKKEQKEQTEDTKDNKQTSAESKTEDNKDDNSFDSMRDKAKEAFEKGNKDAEEAGKKAGEQAGKELKEAQKWKGDGSKETVNKKLAEMRKRNAEEANAAKTVQTKSGGNPKASSKPMD